MKNVLQIICFIFLFFGAIACKSNRKIYISNQSKPAVSEDKMPWRPDMIKIIFSDGKTHFANALNQTTTQIQIRINSYDEDYIISNIGILLKSYSNYAKAIKIQSILIKTALKSIYEKVEQSNFDFGTVGIRFPDGKVQHAWGVTVLITFFSFIMSHSQFNYQCYFKGGTWKINNAGDVYKDGT